MDLIQGQLAYVAMLRENCGDNDGRDKYISQSIVIKRYIDSGISDPEQEAIFVSWQNRILKEYEQ